MKIMYRLQYFVMKKGNVKSDREIEGKGCIEGHNVKGNNGVSILNPHPSSLNNTVATRYLLE